MSKFSVTDTTTGEALRQVGGVSFEYGLSSPFPNQSATPVPSASFQVAGDVENLYRLGNTSVIEEMNEGEVFRGKLSASSDMPVSTMQVDHITNQLNKDIRTWPILTKATMDTSNGRNSIAGLLRHIYSECGVTEYGVTGDFMFSATNSFPNVAYYDHPTDRHYSRYSAGNAGTHWFKSEPKSADPGMSFGLGDSFTLILKTNNNFGRTSEGEISPAQATWTADYIFEQGRVSYTTEENQNDDAFFRIEYTYATRAYKLYFGQINSNNIFTSKYNFNIDSDVPSAPGSPDFTVLEMTRTGDDELTCTLHCYNRSAVLTVTDFVIPISIFSNRVSLRSIYSSLANPDLSTPNIGGREGVQGLYIIKGTDWGIDNADAFPIDFPWFQRTELKNLSLPSLTGNGWQLIQEICQTYGLTLDVLHAQYGLSENLNYGTPWVTGLGAGVGVQATNRELSERVEVVNYNYTASEIEGATINLYKADQVFSVSRGELLETTIQLPEGTDFVLVTQPECYSPGTAIDFWNHKDGQVQSSIYSVFDDDNLEVDRNSWNDSGGSVWVERTENPGEMKLFIQAPNNDLLSKGDTFHISAAGSDIPILQIAGTGIRSNKETISIRTGAPRKKNLNMVGETFDNKLVADRKTAYRVGAGLARLHGSTDTNATGSFKTDHPEKFELAPILKHGSFYSPTSIRMSVNGDVQIQNAVRYTPVKLEKDAWSSMTVGEYMDQWPDGTTCQVVNISPLGKESF